MCVYMVCGVYVYGVCVCACVTVCGVYENKKKRS